MDSEEKQSIKDTIDKVIGKFNRPKILLLNMILLWAALLIMAYHFDMRFFDIQDFVNENCKSFGPMYFNTSLNTTPSNINMSEIPRMEI